MRAAAMSAEDKLTHMDGDRAAMVDVGAKKVTQRVAVARGFVTMAPETLAAIESRAIVKGEVLQVARLAGIMASKRTDELIPLCHTLGLDKLDVEFAFIDETTIAIQTTATCHGKTGVEMEAMVALSTAALTIYDMCKGIDRSLLIGDMHLWHKRGGKSGEFYHPDPPGPELGDAIAWR